MRLLSALIVLMLFVPGILTAPLWDAGSGTNGTTIPSGQGVFSFTPIVIDGNNDLENQAAARGWNGSGTSGSPYVIENLVIETSSEYGVQIKNIDLFVVFRNCSFVSAAISGFYIEGSENIVFLNISSVSRDDIFTFWRCTKIGLENIDIRTNSVYTWAMVNYCDNITLVNSSLYGYVMIYHSEDILLDNITEKGYRSQAVYFRYSTRLTIRNSVFETTLIINSRDSSGILITNNMLNGSRRSEFSNCHGIEIVGNMNSSGSPYGYSFDYCSDVAIRDNDLHGDRGTIILTGTSNVEMFNNTLGSDGLVLSGTSSVLGSLIVPANNSVNGDPILFMKDGDLTPMEENPVHSQMILLNMTDFSLTDRQYDWNPCPLQVHYSSDIHLEGLTISNASIGFSACYSSGITIDNCNFEYTRMTAIHIEHSDGISIRNCEMRHGSPDSVLWMKGCSHFELSSTVMDLDYCRDALYMTTSQSGILRDLEIMTDYGSVYMETCNEIRFDRCSMKEYFEVEMYGCSDVFIRDSEINSSYFPIIMSGCSSMLLDRNRLSTDHDYSVYDEYGYRNRYYSNNLTHGVMRFRIRTAGPLDLELPSNNTVDNRPIIHMTDENKRSIGADEEWGQIILNGVEVHTISGLNVENRLCPIQLISCVNVKLLNCGFRNTTTAVISDYSYPLTVSFCEFNNTSECLVGYDSAPVTVENCFFNVSRHSIIMVRGTGDTPVNSIRVRGCTMIDCSYMIEIEDAEDVDITDCSFIGGSRGIDIMFGYRASIVDCTFYKVQNFCILFERFMNNEVRENLFLNCTLPVTMDRSYGNTVLENLFIGSEREGLRSEYTYNNHNWFYRNIFIDNNGAGEVYNSSHSQAFSGNDDDYWNNSYRRGNYWSDWTGPDTGHDGIVDAPYPIPDNVNSDRYPLADYPFKLIGPPQDISGSVGNGFIEIGWNPPLWNRLLDIEGYRVYREDGQGEIEVFETGPEDLHFNDTTIMNGRRYTYRTTALNSYDESNPSGSVSLVGDGSPPVFTSVSPNPGSIFNQTSVTIEWDCYDTGTGIGAIHVALDGGEWMLAEGADSHTFFNLTDGNHTAVLKVSDMIGNKVEANTSFMVDTKPPRIELRSEIEGSFTNRSNATFLWSAEDELSGLEYYMISVNGAEWVYWGEKEQYRFEDLITGPFSIGVLAVDKAGNGISESIGYFCDIDPPMVEFNTPSSGSNHEDASVYFSWSATDNGSGISRIWIHLDGTGLADVQDMEGYWIDDILPGPHTVKLVVEDLAGNSAEAIVEFTTGALPEIKSFSPVGGEVELGSVIELVLSKDISTIELQVQGVNGTLTISGPRAVFEPDGPLAPLTEYMVIVSGSDMHDLAFGPFNWSFTTVGYAMVFGIVVDQNGKALTGADISVNGEAGYSTDLTGSFELYLDEGHHVIAFHHDGYLNRTVEIDVTYGDIVDMGNIVLEEKVHEDGPGGGEGSGSSYLWVAIVVAVLMITVLIVLLIMRRKKEVEVPTGNEIEEEPEISEDEEEEHDYSGLYSNLPTFEEVNGEEEDLSGIFLH